MADIAPKNNNAPRRPPRERKNSIARPQGGMYKAAGNKEVPDARKTQNEANDKQIRSTIIKSEQTKDYAEVIIRATDPETGHFVEDIVHHDFNTIQQLKALEMLEKEVTGGSIYFRGNPIQVFQDINNPFTPEGIPILTGMGTLKLLTEMTRFKNFSIRDATSKAQRRAQLKILNREWRDKDEQKAEREEEKQVQDSIKDEKKTKTQGRRQTTQNRKEDVETVVDAEIVESKGDKPKRKSKKVAEVSLETLKEVFKVAPELESFNPKIV